MSRHFICRVEWFENFLTWQSVPNPDYPAFSDHTTIQFQLLPFGPGLGHKPAAFVRVRELPW